MHRATPGDRICVCEGAEHVIIAANDDFRSAVTVDFIGVPAREAFVGFEWLQRLMDDTYLTGREHVEDMDDGTWVSVPRYRNGRIVGVTTGWRRVQVPHSHVPESHRPQVAA